MVLLQAYELSTLTGTQVMLLVASETGHVYTFATRKLQPMITSDAGKALIQVAINYRLYLLPQKYSLSGKKNIFVPFIKTTSRFSRNLRCILAKLKSMVGGKYLGVSQNVSNFNHGGSFCLKFFCFHWVSSFYTPVSRVLVILYNSCSHNKSSVGMLW